MDDHKLKVFCTVAETKSFSKASELIRLTQPAVSLQIQALEEMYGTKLFNRSGCIITLTKAGDILYKYAKDINSLYMAAERDIGEFTGIVKGDITVGASSTIGNYILPSIISAFRKKFPKVTIHLVTGNTRSVIEYLNASTIDVAIVEGEVKRQKLIVEKLIPDEMVLIMSPSHSWSGRKDVSIFEVIKEPFIFREEGSGTRQVIEKYFSRHGVSPQSIKISFIMGSTESIKGAVEEGLGVSIVSKWAVRKECRFGSLKTATFKEDRFIRDFSLLYQKSKESSYMLEKFIGFLKKYHFEQLLMNH